MVRVHYDGIGLHLTDDDGNLIQPKDVLGENARWHAELCFGTEYKMNANFNGKDAELLICRRSKNLLEELQKYQLEKINKGL